MRRRSIKGLMTMGILLAATAALRAEVKVEEKSQFKMEGMMGRMMGLFGGKGAKEGVINTVSVKGNRKMTASEDSAEIIDLDEQKIYNLDMKRKSYEVVTFQEMRRRMLEAQEKAAKSVREDKKEAQAPSEKQMEFDFSLKESGQRRSLNGYDCREVVMTMTGHEKGKTLEESGGMVITSHLWLGPEIPAMKEIAEFDQRYAKILDVTVGLGGSADQMAMATAMYPGMKDMIGKMQAENVNMKGAQILTEMTMESVQNPAQVSQEQKQESDDSSSMSPVKGIGGLLSRRLSRKKESEGEANKPKNRTTIMTVNHEVLKISTSVSPSDLEIPAGFKEKK
jgi:hypothetical protein